MCSLLRAIYITVLLSSLFVTANAAHVKVATVDSLSAGASVQRAGTNTWNTAKVGDELYNNDIFRTGDSCVARLQWCGHNYVYVHPNAQILIYKKPSEGKESTLRHFSVMYGALFFLIKSVVGEEKESTTKVFSPTCVVGIRGTSFSIHVDSSDSSTKVRVVHGTVSTMSSDSSRTRTLRPGVTAHYRGDAPVLSTSAMTEAQLDSLRSWVPSSVIDEQLRREQAHARKNYNVINNKVAHTAMVIPFTNTSEYKGEWDISVACARIIAAMSNKRLNRVAISYKDVTNETPLQSGESYGAHYVITGEIREFEVSDYAGINAAADEYHERTIASIGIELTLYDVEKKGKIARDYFSHEVIREHTEGAALDSLDMVCDFSFTDSTFTSSMVGNTAREVIGNMVDFISTHIK